MNEGQQVRECQSHHFGNVDQRYKNGERQVFCKTCQGWKFSADLCSLAVTVKPGRCIRCETRRPAKEEMLCRKCIAELEAQEVS